MRRERGCAGHGRDDARQRPVSSRIATGKLKIQQTPEVVFNVFCIKNLIQKRLAALEQVARAVFRQPDLARNGRGKAPIGRYTRGYRPLYM